MALTENSIKIIKGGTISGNEKSTGATIPVSDTYVSYGGSSDLWGLSWISTDINDATFGVTFSGKSTNTSIASHYLKATNFGFSIPTGATINGILVEIEESKTGEGGNPAVINVDHIRIQIFYTEAPSIIGPFPTFKQI